jgi:hypothetical protein
MSPGISPLNPSRTACERLGFLLNQAGSPVDCDRYSPRFTPCCKGSQCYMTDTASCNRAGGMPGTGGTCLTFSCPVINSCCFPGAASPAPACATGTNMDADTCKRSHRDSIYYPNMDCSIAPCQDIDFNATDFPGNLFGYGACCLRGQCHSKVPPESCRRVGGAYLGTTTCATADACAATSPYGRCCYYQGSALACMPDSLKLDCVVRNGAWTPGQNCSSACKAPRLPDPLPVDPLPIPGIGGTLPTTGICRIPPQPERGCPILDWSIWGQVTGTELNFVFANARKLGRNISEAYLRSKDCDIRLTLTDPVADIGTCSKIYQTATLRIKDLQSCQPRTERAGLVDAQYFEVHAVQNYLYQGSAGTNDLVYQFWLLPGTGAPTVTVSGISGVPPQTARYDSLEHTVSFTLDIGRAPVFTGEPRGTSVTGSGPYTVQVPLDVSTCGQSLLFYDLQAPAARISVTIPDSVCFSAGVISTLAYSISTCNASSTVVFQSNKNIGWLLLETPACLGSVWFTRVPATWNDGVADRLTYAVYPTNPAWSLYLDLNPFFAPYAALRLDHIIGPSGPAEPCATTPPTGTQTTPVVIGATATTAASNGGGSNTASNGQSGNTDTNAATGSSPGTSPSPNTDTNGNGGSPTSPAGTQGQTGPADSTPSPTNNEGAVPVLARLLLATLLL